MINKKGFLAISEIFILIIAIFAFTWMIGSFESVSAGDAGTPNDCASLGGSCQDRCNPQSQSEIGGTCSGNLKCCKDNVENTQQEEVVQETSNGLEEEGTRVAESVVTAVVTKTVMDYFFDNGGATTKTAVRNIAKAQVKMAAAKEAAKEAANFLGSGVSALSLVLNLAAAAGIAYGMSKAGEWAVRAINPEASGDTTIVVGALVGGAAAWAYLSWVNVAIPWSIGAGLVLAAILVLIGKSVEETGVVYYNCNVWAPVKGGEKCETCDEGIVPCSEYQCHSLGKSCEFESDPDTGETACNWANANDGDYPIIQADIEALTTGYKYTPEYEVSSTERGVDIIPAEGNEKCINPYEYITFGIYLDERAECKYDLVRKPNYEDMDSYFSGSTFAKKKHVQGLSIPKITEGDETDYSIYVRCEDNNGNHNVANFIFNFCIQEGIDTLPPTITNVDPRNEAPIPFGVTSLNATVYTNKPAECKWSHTDKAYDSMENMMTARTPSNINAMEVYSYNANLSGFNVEGDNKFYFRCKNNPDLEEKDRFEMTESYIYILRETNPLKIISIEPNNTNLFMAKDLSNITLTVETLGGEEDGMALCYYNTIDDTASYKMFDNTAAAIHSHNLWIGNSGYYELYIRCKDAGGNFDTEKINFTVEIDAVEPLISRAYYEGGDLKITTNEKAECVYSQTSCVYQFDDGIKIPSFEEGISHYLVWDTKTDLYIKCKDEYGNRIIDPTQCSIVIRAQEA